MGSTNLTESIKQLKEARKEKAKMLTTIQKKLAKTDSGLKTKCQTLRTNQLLKSQLERVNMLDFSILDGTVAEVGNTKQVPLYETSAFERRTVMTLSDRIKSDIILNVGENRSNWKDEFQWNTTKEKYEGPNWNEQTWYNSAPLLLETLRHQKAENSAR